MGKSAIHGHFPLVMLNYQRVKGNAWKCIKCSAQIHLKLALNERIWRWSRSVCFSPTSSSRALHSTIKPVLVLLAESTKYLAHHAHHGSLAWKRRPLHHPITMDWFALWSWNMAGLKITYSYGHFSSQPCLMTPEGKLPLNPIKPPFFCGFPMVFLGFP